MSCLFISLYIFMRILFVAPRYHTNQVPIVDSLLKNGHNVYYLVERVEHTEDNTKLSPIICKADCIYSFLEKQLTHAKSEVEKENFRLDNFIPSVRYLVHFIRSIKPDVVVFRDLTKYSLMANAISFFCRVPTRVLYTQSACYKPTKSLRDRILIFLRRIIFTNKTYSPVYVANSSFLSLKLFSQDIHFLPFALCFDDGVLRKQYLSNNRINLLDVGKYRDYKDHFVLIKALIKLPIDILKEFKITIAGQCIKDDEIVYYNKLNSFIMENHLDEYVDLRKNIDYKMMANIYKENDVFILTSKHELASVSLLEAMGEGLICISSDNNGTASYINKSLGYTFTAMDADDLQRVLIDLARKKLLLPKMGVKTYQYARENFGPELFYSRFMDLIRK